MTTDWTMFKDPVTTVCAIVGAGLGVFNFMHSFRRGTLRMIQPSLASFGYDERKAKIFLRATLYTTGKRGRMIESLYVKVRQEDAWQTFDYWMYGETGCLKIGSGFLAGEDGVSFNHHFVLLNDGESYQFLTGAYVIDVYARTVNRGAPLLVTTLKLSLSAEVASGLRDGANQAYFTWDTDARTYRCVLSESLTRGTHSGAVKKKTQLE